MRHWLIFTVINSTFTCMGNLWNIAYWSSFYPYLLLIYIISSHFEFTPSSTPFDKSNKFVTIMSKLFIERQNLSSLETEIAFFGHISIEANNTNEPKRSFCKTIELKNNRFLFGMLLWTKCRLHEHENVNCIFAMRNFYVYRCLALGCSVQ